MPVKLMNKGQRTIRFARGEDGLFAPKAVGIFNTKTAKVLMNLYPKDIIDLDNLTVDYDQTAVKDFSGDKGKGKKVEAKEPSDDEKLAQTLKDENEK